MVACGGGQSRPSWHQPYSTRLSNMGRVGAQGLSSSSCLCWHCGRGGHNRRDCSARRRGLEAQRSDRGGRGGHQFAEVAHISTVSQALVVACSHPGNRWSSSRYAPWLIDSGVSQHMSLNRSDFLTLECLSEEIKLYLGDEAWIPATAQGKIRLNKWATIRRVSVDETKQTPRQGRY